MSKSKIKACPFFYYTFCHAFCSIHFCAEMKKKRVRKIALASQLYQSLCKQHKMQLHQEMDDNEGVKAIDRKCQLKEHNPTTYA